MEITIKIDLEKLLRSKYLDMHKDGMYSFDFYYEQQLEENIETWILLGLDRNAIECCVEEAYNTSEESFPVLIGEEQ
jgi:hypothetical protein